MKPSRWCVAAAGALLFVGIGGTASASNAVDGLRVRAEHPEGYRRSQFSERTQIAKLPSIIPLREAWESGAFAWTPARRAKFANDTALRAVTAGLDKSEDVQRADRDPAGWLPGSNDRCSYVAKWIAVKLTWGLAVDQTEFVRLRKEAAACASTAPAVPSTSVTSTPASSVESGTTPSPGSATTTQTTSVVANNALKVLDSIRIGPEYTAGYDRELFPHWKDLDGDGCDARENVLIRDSLVKAAVTTGCRVTSGKWMSPYDGATWTDPSDIDIDHVVALNEAWQSGAYAWTTQQRTNYANDLTDARTLMAVTDSVNQAKSDKDPTEWLPPLASYRCSYLSNWVAVKARWSLRMDEAEYSVVKAALSTCGSAALIQTVVPVVVATTAAVTTTAATAVSPTLAPSTTATGVLVTPGAYCAPFGAVGQSSSGVTYTRKPSDTEARNRWRR